MNKKSFVRGIDELKFNRHFYVLCYERKENLHSVVQVGVFVEEPQHSVVGLGMDALLLEQGNLFLLICKKVQFQHL